MENIRNMGSDYLPTAAEMLEMLNVDILPFFDNYEPKSFVFKGKYRAETITTETSGFIIVALNNGMEIKISKLYFRSPITEKTRIIQRLQEILS
jgi:hypothetical protein